MDPIALLMIAGATLGAWWLRRYQRSPARLRAAMQERYEPEAEVVLHVAGHEAETRGHEWLSSLHVLYGLLQDEQVAAAVRESLTEGGAEPGDSGGASTDLDALEDRVLAALAEHRVTSQTASEAGWIVGYAVMIAEHTRRKVSCIDLWAALAKSRSEAAALIDDAGVSAVEVLFRLFHGEEPRVAEGLAGDVHVVLRNDHYTTREFVCDVLKDVFALPEPEANTHTETTHEVGRAVIGRYPARDARDKIAQTRRLAREQGHPLWIGVEPI